MRSASNNSLYQLEINEVNKHADIPENPQFVFFFLLVVAPSFSNEKKKKKKSYAAQQAVEIEVSPLLPTC